MKDFIKKEIVRIRHLVGDRAQVIGAVSGGVDSTVAAKLMQEAIGMLPSPLAHKHCLEHLEKLMQCR
jgi:GMP synthase PP-ATPase subunit